MAEEDALGKYLVRVREHQSDAEPGEVEKRVESLLNDLKLPWRPDGGSDAWSIESDVGFVSVALSEDDSVLSIWQVIGPVPDKPKKNGELYRDMLRINAGTQGSCLAIIGDPGVDEVLAIIARLAAPTIDKPELAMAIEDVFATSKLFDPPDA